MSSHDRKSRSEAKLQLLGVPINKNLPAIESEDEVELRSSEELTRRLIALWAVVDRAFLGEKSETANYIKTNELATWLSSVEQAYLFEPNPTKRDNIHFSWQLESLFFVAWCAGLLPCPEVPNEQSSVKPILGLFPAGGQEADRLRAAIKPRSKTEVLDRADILYRVHWAVRNAKLTGAKSPAGIDGGVVQEWHRAVNWMIRYDSEDDWDQVGTDT